MLGNVNAYSTGDKSGLTEAPAVTPEADAASFRGSTGRGGAFGTTETATGLRRVPFNAVYTGEDGCGIVAEMAVATCLLGANIVDVDATARNTLGVVLFRMESDIPQDENVLEFKARMEKAFQERITAWRDVQPGKLKNPKFDFTVHPGSDVKPESDMKPTYLIARLNVELNKMGMLALVLLTLHKLNDELVGDSGGALKIGLTDCTQRQDDRGRAEIVLGLSVTRSPHCPVTNEDIVQDLEFAFKQMEDVNHAFVQVENSASYSRPWFSRSYKELANRGPESV